MGAGTAMFEIDTICAMYDLGELTAEEAVARIKKILEEN